MCARVTVIEAIHCGLCHLNSWNWDIKVAGTNPHGFGDDSNLSYCQDYAESIFSIVRFYSKDSTASRYVLIVK